MYEIFELSKNIVFWRLAGIVTLLALAAAAMFAFADDRD